MYRENKRKTFSARSKSPRQIHASRSSHAQHIDNALKAQIAPTYKHGYNNQTDTTYQTSTHIINHKTKTKKQTKTLNLNLKHDLNLV